MTTRWPVRVGELAQMAGVTVRTLHHYDHIGLLRPSRSVAGQRVFWEQDLRRLYRILALRRLGFGLPEIAASLEGTEFDIRSVVRRQLDQVRRQLLLQRQLEARLVAIVDALDGCSEPPAELLTDVMEVLNQMEKYYSAEQLEQIDRHRRELGEEGLAQGRKNWAELIAAVEAERARGVAPGDPRVQELARRWMDLVDQMTGGDAGIFKSMRTMFQQEGPEAASGGHVSKELWEYVRLAVAAGDVR